MYGRDIIPAGSSSTRSLARLGLGEPQIKFRGAYWGPAICCGERVGFLEPHTYMNLSGLSVGEAARYQNLEPSDILIIFRRRGAAVRAHPYAQKRLRGRPERAEIVIGALGTLDVPRLASE